MNSGAVDLAYLDPPYNTGRRHYAGTPAGAPAGAGFTDSWNRYRPELLADPAARAIVAAAGLASGRSMRGYLGMMAPRLVELRRILKPGASLYLQGSPAASHYLKVLMDLVFGRLAFRNEIVWKRSGGHNNARRYGAVHDVLLYYVNPGRPSVWNGPRHEYTEAQRRDRFRFVDPAGRRYRLDDLTGPRGNGNASGQYPWRGTMPGPNRGWGYKLEQLEAWWTAGRIQTTRSGRPRTSGLKVFEAEAPAGQPAQDLWTDISGIPSSSGERTGYPTQKPLELLERIILASSRPGDMVLDPFSGSGTTCLAADRLNRAWCGIDQAPAAAATATSRIKVGLFGLAPIHREDPPVRTDLDAQLRR